MITFLPHFYGGRNVIIPRADIPEVNALSVNSSQSPNLWNYSLQNVVSSLIMDSHISNNNKKNIFPVLKVTKGYIKCMNVFHQLFNLSVPKGSHTEHFFLALLSKW